MSDMMRTAILSFAVATLLAVPGCEKKDTTVPGSSLDEEAEWAPPEGEELEEHGVEEDEEKAPNLSRRRHDDEA